MFIFFFFNDTATTEIYTLSLHDALPISRKNKSYRAFRFPWSGTPSDQPAAVAERVSKEEVRVYTSWNGADRKSTRLNSSHANISYAVFCLKKKKHYNKFMVHHLLLD